MVGELHLQLAHTLPLTASIIVCANSAIELLVSSLFTEYPDGYLVFDAAITTQRDNI